MSETTERWHPKRPYGYGGGEEAEDEIARLQAQLAAKEQELALEREGRMVESQEVGRLESVNDALTEANTDLRTKLAAAEERAKAYRLAAGPCTPYREIGGTYCQHGFKPATCVFAPTPTVSNKEAT